MSISIALRVALAIMLGAVALLCCGDARKCDVSSDCDNGQTCVYDQAGCQVRGTCANPVDGCTGRGAFPNSACDCADNPSGAIELGCLDVGGFNRAYNPQGCRGPGYQPLDASDEVPPFAIDSGVGDGSTEASDADARADGDVAESGSD